MGADLRKRAAAAALGTLTLGLVALGSAPESAQAQTWSTMQLSRQLQAEESLQVHVKYGAGRFHVGPVDSRHLYQVRLRYDEEAFEPIHEYRNGTLRLGVEGSGRRTTLRRGDSEGELELRLSRDVAMDVEMEFGAVRAELELGGLRLRNLKLTTGASDARVAVSEPNPIQMERVHIQVGAAAFNAQQLGHLRASEIEVEAGVGDVRLGFQGLDRPDTRVKVSMGLGSVEIRVPRGVGVELSRSTFLTSVNAPGLDRRGEVFVSSDWDRAERRIRIEVDAAFGSISILRTDR
jgi:hypothetical protein